MSAPVVWSVSLPTVCAVCGREVDHITWEARPGPLWPEGGPRWLVVVASCHGDVERAEYPLFGAHVEGLLPTFAFPLPAAQLD